MTLTPWLLWAAPPLIPFAINALNLLTWRAPGRPSRPPTAGGNAPGPRVSVLIPARNEQRTIHACVHAALSVNPAVHEVVVCDDGSTDATPTLLANLQAAHPRLRVIQGAPLPPGWVGKPHACHQLAIAATGDLLCFIDADVILEPDGVAHILSSMGGIRPADVLTAVPKQVMGSTAEQLMMPLLHLSYTAWLPLRLIDQLKDPRVLAANGQVLAISRDAYTRIGGFAGVRGEVVDDMALCRQAKTAGARVRFVDGQFIARCRMYDSGTQLIQGFAKNLFEGVGGTGAALIAVLSMHIWLWVLPWLAAAAGAALGDTTLFAAGTTGGLVGLLTRAALAVRMGHPRWSTLAHPGAVLGLVYIGLRSWWWSRRDNISWAGRRYPKRSQRLAQGRRP